MDLTETQLDTEQVYAGGFIQVYKDRASLPDGGVCIREYVKHPGAVAIMALLDNGNLIMERQFRYAPRQEFIELPAGKIDHGEAPLLTAQLEVFELSPAEAIDWIRSGKITDSKTIVGLFWLEKTLNNWA